MNANQTITKRTALANALTMAAVAALALAIAPAAKAQGKGCSTSTLKGTYAQKDTGFITSPPALAGPFAGVSTVTFDGNGTVTSSGMVSLNGTIIPVTQKGTYTVNADCTGSYSVQIAPLGISGHGFFVMDDSANELQILVTDSGLVVTCVAQRRFPKGYSE